MPAGVRIGGPLPDPGFLSPGLDVPAEAADTTRCGAGRVLSTAGGIAIVHLEPAIQPPGAGFAPSSPQPSGTPSKGSWAPPST